ncbi:Src-like 3 domains [Teratosphaeria destructans]|uniref:Src-like 3 domains n=1 Tax=Teratosphaeria destructans TaxID=418781 RepID=A0A9W7SNR2_9PEZI|nr:Src-like 3 domains [Teratosphaeria destructans]
MAASGGADGLLDMGKELTCSICTDILYQPLTLLDCLHTFCGSCLKEWFAFQATAAARTKPPRNATPYTCPSCREHVRGTRVDWRSTALLEGFLRANPDREKSTEEKEEMKERYQPGDDVIPKVERRRDDTDSEDERLMEEVRELSMGQVDPEAARRRAERRAERAARYRREEGRRHTQAASRSGHLPLSEDRLREHNANESQIEHQPSLRSLLSNASPVDSHDVQQDILQSIYSEGLLDGVDLDNLTTEQEEELTERIAEAYRRRQRRRDRPRNRDRSYRTSHSQDPPASAGVDTQGRHHSRTNSASLQAPRIRPPISRPHLFEQHENTTDRRIRSASATSRRSQRSASRGDALAPASQDSRSATDLSENSGTENAERERRQRLSSNTAQFATQGSRGSGPRTHISHMRASSHDRRSTAVPPQAQGPLEP